MGLLSQPALNQEEKLEKAKEKATKSRSHLILDAPYFGSLTARLKPVPDYNCDSLYTDGVHLGYNPDALIDMQPDHIKGIYAKSVVHLICGHHVRRKHRKSKLWKKATNLVASAIAKEAGFVFPDETQIDISYAQRVAEEVYAELEIEEIEDENGKPSPGNGDDDQDWDDDQDIDQDGDDDQDWDDDQDGDQEQEDPQPNGEVRDLPPKVGNPIATKSEKSVSEQEWKSMAQVAAQAAKGMGDLPGCVERLIKAMVESKLCWKEVLREWLEKTVYKDYTWMKLNRRYVYHGLILPSLEGGYDLIKASCYTDASGSVYDRQLEQFGAEMTSILEEFPDIEFTAKYFDTSIKHDDTQVYTKDDLPIILKTRAGGGTDFIPIFEDVERDIKETGETPKFLIIFTDLECSRFPEVHPDYPVLWIKVGDSNWASEPPFGDVLPLEIDYET
jgi:predicted metal-dependent peptidase